MDNETAQAVHEYALHVAGQFVDEFGYDDRAIAVEVMSEFSFSGRTMFGQVQSIVKETIARIGRGA